MERNQGRRISAEDKLGILGEGRQSGTMVSELCRRHQVSHAQFYRWERIAREGALEALRNGARKAKGALFYWFLSKSGHFLFFKVCTLQN